MKGTTASLPWFSSIARTFVYETQQTTHILHFTLLQNCWFEKMWWIAKNLSNFSHKKETNNSSNLQYNIELKNVIGHVVTWTFGRTLLHYRNDTYKEFIFCLFFIFNIFPICKHLADNCQLVGAKMLSRRQFQASVMYTFYSEGNAAPRWVSCMKTLGTPCESWHDAFFETEVPKII